MQDPIIVMKKDDKRSCFLKVSCHTKFRFAEREAQCILGEYGPLMKISSFVHLDAKFSEIHVFSVEFSKRYYSEFLMKIPCVQVTNKFCEFHEFFDFLLNTTADK